MSQAETQVEYEFTLEEELEFENLEMPQLIRRDAVVYNHSSEESHVLITEQSTKIYCSEECPICLCSDQQLHPLKCGHTFCQADIKIMIENSQSNYGLISCPLCRAYQNINSIEEIELCPQKKDSIAIYSLS